MLAARLQAWAADLAAYVKQLDPNHLVMLGLIGMFGASTPSLLQENPYDLSMDTYSKGGIYQADPVCQVMILCGLQLYWVHLNSSAAADRPGHPSFVAHLSTEPADRGFSLKLGCGVQGEDFSAIVGIPEVDIGSVHVYLENFPICTECALPSTSTNPDIAEPGLHASCWFNTPAAPALPACS